MSPSTGKPAAVYQIKVTLKNIRPPIWRRLLVPADTKLPHLHHMLQATQRINGRILVANLHFLFWLSLMPFVTVWKSCWYWIHATVDPWMTTMVSRIVEMVSPSKSKNPR